MSNYKHDLITHVLLFIAMLVWASAFVGIRVGLHGYSPGALALLRYFVASIAMIPLYIFYRSKGCSMNKNEFIRIILIGVFGIGVYNIALNYGEVNIDAATASFIVNQAPVLIVIFAVLFLKERLNFAGWLGFFISCIGVCIIAFSEHEKIQLQIDVFYIIIATITSAVYTVMQKPLLTKFNGIELTALVIWSGTAVLLVFAPQLTHEVTIAPLFSTFTAIYLGIFPGVIAYTLWSLALARTSASQAGSYLYILPLLTTLVGWICIKEIPSMLSFSGGLVALVGSIIVQFGKNKEEQKSG